jgi:SAM-dependent methyltransferase
VTQGLPFEDGRFDLVFNPVSICYIRDAVSLWREAYRVTKPGGTLLTAFDTILNYIVDADEERIVWRLPFDPVTQDDARAFLEAEDAGMQFSHDLTDTIGAIIKSGYVLEDLFEDVNGEGRLYELNIPTYVVLKAKKPL